MITTDIERRRFELRRAVVELRDRGLISAAKWAAEQLVGLPSKQKYLKSNKNNSDNFAQKEARNEEQMLQETKYSTEKLQPRGVGGRKDEEGEVDDEEELDKFLLGKSFFDSREYRRAAHALESCRGKKSFFLRCYSLYLAGEKRKEEEIVETGGPLGKSEAANEELPGLEAVLREAYLREGEPVDAFGAYLYGTVLRERGKGVEAGEVLCASLASFPWNWSAWLQLQALCTSMDDYLSLQPRLPDHWMRTFFEASVLLDLHRNAEGLSLYRKLQGSFPGSEHVAAQTAVAHYNLREFEEAEALFEKLLRSDPYRVEGMDVYSNILYVKEMFGALSFLAHKAILTDKYRPETCCIIGNYYSLKAQHEKAVLYFQRALKLNRAYLSAWTLMGHEYVELKNTPAAIEAYRRAVDINPRDYRAWYGLGQTYEILAMPYYALYYYRQATELRPTDARMWCAMGQCYESEALQQREAAIACYEKAVANNDREGIALHKLAKLHASMGFDGDAAYYYRKNLERMDSEQSEGQPEYVEALLFLAQHLRNEGRLEDAETYCTRLLDFGGPAKEDAKALLREIHSVQRHATPPSMELETYSP